MKPTHPKSKRARAVLDPKKYKKAIDLYTTPSGLVLLVATLLTVIGFWTHPLVGSIGVVLLCVFLGYRFNRERGVTNRAVGRVQAQQRDSRARIDRHGVRLRDNEAHIGVITARLEGFDGRLAEVTTRQQTDTGLRLRLEYRVRQVADEVETFRGVATGSSSSPVGVESETPKNYGPSGPRGDGNLSFESFRSDVGVLLARHIDGNKDHPGLVLIVGPEHSGLSYVFDTLRSLPSFTYVASYDVHSCLGSTAERYPAELLERFGSQLPIEVAPEVGGFLPSFRREPEPTERPVQVDRVQPSALSFDTDRIDRLQQVAGPDGPRLVLVVRDPLRSIDVIRKCGETPDARRQPCLSAVVEQYRMSLSFMEKLAKERAEYVDAIVNFDSLIADPSNEVSQLSTAIGHPVNVADVAPVVENIEAFRMARMSETPYYGATWSPRSDDQAIVDMVEQEVGKGELDGLRESFRRLAALSHV